MSKTELKPCPFCEGEVRVYFSDELKAYFVEHIHRWDELDCFLYLPELISKCNSIEDAVGKWNRRATENENK